MRIRELLKKYDITELVMLLYHQPFYIKNFFRDEDLDRSAGQALGNGELIEVPGVVVVDRAPEKPAQVPDSVPRGRSRSRDPVELSLDRLREIGLEIVLDHRAPGDLLQVRTLMEGLLCHGATL